MLHIPHYFAGNSKQLYAVAWNACILVRIPMPDGRAYLSDMAKGTRWATDNGAKLANISYNGATSGSVAVSVNYSDNIMVQYAQSCTATQLRKMISQTSALPGTLFR
ncbi:hypothetical protein ABO04_04680 [Nitrosomonas sp. HPC101]|uniref:hypothetical protein n=1 Tax=Nitrosomonas sp. HPC101 TaxID=1658667 RepID=UPI0013DE0381|nr:hypothetical protein [Nitrosomonas sp. HPC101]MXS85229.1 hypothetical protein [Nitrosomonas sp. HPC101]